MRAKTSGTTDTVDPLKDRPVVFFRDGDIEGTRYESVDDLYEGVAYESGDSEVADELAAGQIYLLGQEIEYTPPTSIKGVFKLKS